MLALLHAPHRMPDRAEPVPDAYQAGLLGEDLTLDRLGLGQAAGLVMGWGTLHRLIYRECCRCHGQHQLLQARRKAASTSAAY